MGTSFDKNKYFEYLENDPKFGDTRTYPDNLVMGDKLFPMIYIYFIGDTGTSKRISNKDVFESAKNQYIINNKETNIGMSKDDRTLTRNLADDGGSNIETISKPKISSIQDSIVNLEQSGCRKLRRMLISAIDNNPQYLWSLTNKVSELMGRYKGRLSQNRGSYYSSKDKKSYDYFPILDSVGVDGFDACMETLRLLFENGVIDYSHDFNIRPINIYSGEFVSPDTELNETMNVARSLGLPSKGIFTKNNRPQRDFMFKTFSGIDIEAVASLNTVVTELKGLTQLSWSIHKGKGSQRPVGKSSPFSRTDGTRTIAGTLIFTLSDHHPLLELLPGDYPIITEGNMEDDPALWKPVMMPDQLPPFDLVIMMTNEYGQAAMLSIYGIQVIDEGTVIGVDNMITECVIQYTASAMDPIMSVNLDENGNIDPFGLLQGGYSRLWRHRETVIAGAAYTDLEEEYESYYDSISKTMDRNLSKKRTNR